MPLLGLLSRLVSAPPQKPRLAQNEAQTAPQQRYGTPHRQYLAAENKKHTYLTSKYQPVGALDSKCPSSVSYFAAIRLRVVCKKAHHTFDYRRRRLPRLGLKHSPYGKNCNNNRDNPVLYGRSQVQRGSQD